MRLLPVLLLLAACGKPSPTPLAELGGVDAVTGEVQAERVAVPDFTVVNHDGTPRSRDDLLWHPTVLWFFPAAGTPG